MEEKLGDEHGSARTYHELGMLARRRRDFDAAEQWCKRALAIEEKHGDGHSAALTCGVMGLLARDRSNHLDSCQWFFRSITGFRATRDDRMAKLALQDLEESYKLTPPDDRPKVVEMWKAAGLGKFPFPQ